MMPGVWLYEGRALTFVRVPLPIVPQPLCPGPIPMLPGKPRLHLRDAQTGLGQPPANHGRPGPESGRLLCHCSRLGLRTVLWFGCCLQR